MTNTLTVGESTKDSTLPSTTTVNPAADSARPAAAAPEFDPALVEAFAGRVIADFAAAAATAMTVIGDRLGLFDAMTGAGALTASDLAARTGLQPRLVKEWLAAQVVSGYLNYHPGTDDYDLPLEHAMALSIAASPAFVVGAAEVVAGQYATLDHLESAFRADGAVEYSVFPETVTHGIERFFRTAYTHQLVEDWFPAVDGLVRRLADGARVADIGCGHGAATLVMAAAWPSSEFTGYDLDERSVIVARSRAEQAGAPANIEFRVADADAVGDGPYDVVVFFDALHDLG